MKRLHIDFGGAAACVVVFPTAPLLIAVGTVEAERGAVLRVNVKPDKDGACGLRGVFATLEQLGPDSLPSILRGDFDGLDVGDGSFRLIGPVAHREARKAIVFFGDPSGAVFAVDDLLHVTAAEAERWLKAGFLDGVKLGKIVGAVETIEHRDNLLLEL